MTEPGARPFQLLQQDGTPDEAGVARIGLGDGDLLTLLRHLRFARRADEVAAALQRQGHLAVYGPVLGQEGVQVGSAYALREDDFVFPAYRELAVALVRGLDLPRYLSGWKGIIHGSVDDPRREAFAQNTVPVATHLPHAVGWALGAKLDGRDACAVAYFGDGATSEGDFHEACNFAGVFRAPVVFVCQNNHYAISVPLASQTAVPIFEKARAYGFPGVRIDGNDVLAAYAATREALDRARSDGLPTLIEALTYRMAPHSTADDPRRYRTVEEEQRWLARDPVRRFEAFLEKAGLLDEQTCGTLDAETERFAADLRERVIALQPGTYRSLFAHVFETTPPVQARQADRAAHREGRGSWP